MAKIYRVFIETEDADNWNELREIIDGPCSPMTTPYRMEIKIINAWSRNVDVNRDWDFIAEQLNG